MPRPSHFPLFHHPNNDAQLQVYENTSSKYGDFRSLSFQCRHNIHYIQLQYMRRIKLIFNCNLLWRLKFA
jgi:hypothetical protein